MSGFGISNCDLDSIGKTESVITLNKDLPMLITSNLSKDNSLVARECAAGEIVFMEKDDNAVIGKLKEEVEKYNKEANDGKRLECYLLLKEMTSLWLLQTMGLPQDIQDNADVFVTTTEDLLAKTIFVKLPNQKSAFPSLDREPISRNSESRVHLVILGFSSQTEALAINAALIAHYPNYCKNVRHRTRITIVDDNVFEGRDHLIQRYTHLFENSYYRTIDLTDSNPQCPTHHPLYEGARTDFVDVEWEFVRGNVQNEALRMKLSEWCQSPQQQLTISICHPDINRNYSEVFSLPEDIYRCKTPVLFHTESDDMVRLIKEGGNFSSVYPFGSSLCDINTLRVLKSLAQRVNYVYSHCLGLPPNVPITAPSNIDEGKLESLWQKVGSLQKQYSNIYNAMTLGTKMHSVGHTSEDWQEYYALSKDEIDILTEVEHNRWSVEELILGYRPVNPEEQKLVEEDISQKRILRKDKVHYDLRAFNDLRADSTGKNVNVYDMALTQGIPLIIKSCITN